MEATQMSDFFFGSKYLSAAYLRAGGMFLPVSPSCYFAVYWEFKVHLYTYKVRTE